MLTGGQIAIIVVTVFWAILVCFLAVVLWRLARLIDQTTVMVAELGEQAEPLLDDLTRTVRQASEQLDRMEGVTKGVAGVSQNVSAATGVMTSVVGGPLVKAAAFTYGVRKALGNTLDPNAGPSRTTRSGGPDTGKRTNRNVP